MEEKTAIGLSRNTTAAFAYLLGWITGVAVILLEKKDRFVRFHAAQSIIFFGAITLVNFIPFVGGWLSRVTSLIGFVVWLICIIKAYQGEEFEIPIIGPFAKSQIKK